MPMKKELFRIYQRFCYLIWNFKILTHSPRTTRLSTETTAATCWYFNESAKTSRNKAYLLFIFHDYGACFFHNSKHHNSTQLLSYIHSHICKSLVRVRHFKKINIQARSPVSLSLLGTTGRDRLETRLNTRYKSTCFSTARNSAKKMFHLICFTRSYFHDKPERYSLFGQ